jgi:adenylosuccinate lyase
MPFKINPILVERLMGMARLLRAYSVAAQENVAVRECRDISQSSVERVIFPDATAIEHYMAQKATGLVKKLVLFPERMTANINETKGVWAGARIRHALVDQGVDDNDAYLYIQQCSFAAIKDDIQLALLLERTPISASDPRTGHGILGPDRLIGLFNIDEYVREGIEVIFGRFPAAA